VPFVCCEKAASKRPNPVRVAMGIHSPSPRFASAAATERAFVLWGLLNNTDCKRLICDAIGLFWIWSQ